MKLPSFSIKSMANAETNSAATSVRDIGSRIQFWLYRWYLKLGAWGVLALALLVIVLLFWYFYIGWMRDEISQRRHEAEKSIVTLSFAKPFTSAVTTELPASSEFMQRVQTAYDILESNGFEVKEATYQQSVNKTDKLQRLTVELPMMGQYPSLRMALAALMEQPGLDVESVSMERKNIADETLDMRIRFSLLGVSE